MIELRDASYVYPGASAPSVLGVSRRVEPGEVVALVGANGSGKSTVATLMNGARLSQPGCVLVDGHDPAAGAAERDAVTRLVGLVRQDPEDQLVSSLVWDEVAFGPCNLGLPPQEVRRRVDAALAACGLSELAARGCDELSGGEQQRLAVAGMLALDPAYLVMDEATSYLDEAAREQVRGIARSQARAGRGVVLVTHLLADVLACDRVVVLDAGRLVWQGSVRELAGSAELLARAGMAHDPLAAVLRPLAVTGLEPEHTLDMQRIVAHVRSQGLWEPVAAALEREETAQDAVHANGPALSLDAARVTYAAAAALDGASILARPGRVTLVAGPSGSGKSTALRCLAGVLDPDEGSATLGGAPVRPGQVGLAFQRPEEQLFCPTVLEDVGFGPRNLGLPEREVGERSRASLRMLGIPEELENTSPLALSGGQARRVALAGVIALAPAAYALDEPSAGLDGRGRAELRRLVSQLAASGAAVVVVSHDVGEWLPVATDVVLLSRGRDVWHGSARLLARSPEIFRTAGMRPPLACELRAALGSEAGDAS